VKVRYLEAIPLTAPLPTVLRTAQDSKDHVSLVLVRMETDDGIVGWRGPALDPAVVRI
jgi:L-alanine-DL-glutamate epimerase-like enolase superfamily enzyme